jgi:transcriptional regulator with XRE-family HTH domain
MSEIAAVFEARQFGTLLRRYRQRAGFSQQALAERAQLSADALSALERGKRRAPYANTVRALVSALELSQDERVQAALVRLAWRSKQPGQCTRLSPMASTGSTSHHCAIRS